MIKQAPAAAPEWACDLHHHLRQSGPIPATDFSARASSLSATQLLNRLNALIALAVSAAPAERPALRLETQRNNRRLQRPRGGCQDYDQIGRSKFQHPRGAGLVAVVTNRKQRPHNLPQVSSRPATGSRHMPDTNLYFSHTIYHALYDYHLASIWSRSAFGALVHRIANFSALFGID